MKNSSLLGFLAFFLYVSSPCTVTAAYEWGDCVFPYNRICFFNGVWNTQDQATKGVLELKTLIGTSFKNESIHYVLFYNQTGKVRSKSSFEDIAEVFLQRATELDPSGQLAKRWEYLWECLGEDSSLIERLSAAYPSMKSLLSQLYTYIVAESLGKTAHLLADPPTWSDHGRHAATLVELANLRRKLILVGHSQGNLFLNVAFDGLIGYAAQGSVKAVHIAPASTTLRGGYILANIDTVINSLRLYGEYTVPPNNIVLLPSLSDLSGHTLLGTYLDPNRPARGTVASLITTAMRSITNPICYTPPPE